MLITSFSARIAVVLSAVLLVVSGCAEPQTPQPEAIVEVPTPTSEAPTVETSATAMNATLAAKAGAGDEALQQVNKTLQQRGDLFFIDVALRDALSFVGEQNQLQIDTSRLSIDQQSQTVKIEESGQPLGQSLQKLLSSFQLKYEVQSDGVISILPI